jgi:phosphatidylinositol alpha 1,6-mannosyltransferase
MRPLKIMLGADTYPPDVNGAARFTEQLAHGLAGRGHEVRVLCPSIDGRPESRGGARVREHRLVSRRAPGHPSFRICLPWQVSPAITDHARVLAPDVVHVQSHFAVGRTLIGAAVQRGVPLVATNHFMPENLLGYVHVPEFLHGPLARWAWRDLANVYRHAHVVTAPTPRAVQLLAEAAGLPGAVPVSCGIDLDRFAPSRRPDDVPTVLFVGRLDREKRVDELLRAVAALSAQFKIRAEIVGDGSCRRELEALADQLDIRPAVRFRGVVSEEELVDAYARCAVFCMPGVAELQSLATMEAMAAGAPVVAADAMALPHLVQPGRTGWLYPPGNINALTSRLAVLLANRRLRQQMGTAGRELIASHAADRTLDAFEALYVQAMRSTDSDNRPLSCAADIVL